MRAMDQINNLEKVFREGGMLEKAIMDVKGDIAWLKDIRESLSDAYEAMEDGHMGAVAHLQMDNEGIEENRMGFSDLEKLGKENASKVDHEARRQGSADMEPGDADQLRYQIAKKMGLVEGVLDSDDDDGFMARSQLYFMARDAITLHGMIDDRDDLEPWVQSKIAQSSEAIDAVRRYTEYNAQKQPQEPEMEPEMEEGYEVLPPMDKEKYQERDGLEGPIPTRSGKVLYYDPKAGKYYDPDSDIYLSYDDWKQYDESMVESVMENCGCEKEDDLSPAMRYLQLKAEGREEEAQQLAEALPLIPLAVAAARTAAPWVIRQIAGRGAGNIAKSVAKRGLKRTGKVVKRALRRGKNKAKAAGAAGANAAIYGTGAGGSDNGFDMDVLTKMNSSADEGKPALNENKPESFQAIGRKLEDMSMDYKAHKADVDALTKTLGLKDPMETLNYVGRVGEHLEHFGVPGAFGAKNLDELSKKAMLDKEKVLTIVKMGNAKVNKEGDVDGSKYQDAPVSNQEPNDYVEGAGFVKSMRKQLEAKMAEGKSPHKKGTEKYKKHMAAMHAGGK